MPVGMSYNKNSGGSQQESTFEYVRAKIVTGKGAGRVYFLDQMEEGFDGEGNKVNVYRSYKFNFTDLPEFPKLPEDTTIPECQVVYDNREGKIVGIGPYNGSVKGKPVDLGPKTPDGSKPMSRIQDKPNKQKPGTTYKDVSFWCIYQITDADTDGGLWVGGKGFHFLKDKFYERGDGNTDIIGDTEKTNTWAARLRDWGTQLGLWNEDIPWPADGNVLPELLRRIQEKPIEVLLIYKQGSVQEIQAIHSGVVRNVVVFDDSDIIEPVKKEPVKSAGAQDDIFGK